MPLLERFRTDHVVIGSFAHAPGEAPTEVSWWTRVSLAFTSHGTWQVRARRGGGVITPATVLVSEAYAEHEYRHPDGMDDRVLSVIYRGEPDPGPALVVPHAAGLRSLRKSLVRELANGEFADPGELDALCLALLELSREPADRGPRLSRRSAAVVGRLRASAAARYTDLDFDLVAEAAAVGMSRTRLIHAFRDAYGVTPHRYLVELRTTHAARLLTQTRAPVTEICYGSGFGSMTRFHAAFRTAYGCTPSQYREQYG